MSDLGKKPGPWFGGPFERAIKSAFSFGPCDDLCQALVTAEPGNLVRNDNGDCVLRLSPGGEGHITDRDLVLKTHADSPDLSEEVVNALAARHLEDLDVLEQIADRLKGGRWSAEMDRAYAGGDFIVRHDGKDVLKLSLNSEGRNPEATVSRALMPHAANLLIRMDGMIETLRHEKKSAAEVARAEEEKRRASEIESDLGSFGI